MAISYKVLGQSQLGTTLDTVYTVPSATQAVVSTLAISNTTNSMANVTLGIGSGQPSTWNLSWTSTTDPVASPAPGERGVKGVAYGNGLYVTVSGDTSQEYFGASTDLVTWLSWTTSAGTNGGMSGITYGNGLFVAAGRAIGVVTSTNGISWTNRTSAFGSTNNPRALVFGNNTYVISGDNGLIQTSTDGITWTTRTSNFATNSIRSLGYENGVFLAGSDSGGLRTSTDAITWTTASFSLGNTNTVWGFAYGNGTYIAVGGSGRIRSSTDAVTWVTRTSGTTDSLKGVTYGEGLFYAATDNDVTTIIGSTDGVTWTSQPPLTISSVTNTGLGTLKYVNSLFFIAPDNNGVPQIAKHPLISKALLYNTQVSPNSENSLTIGLTLGAGDTIWAKSNTGSAITVHAFGSEIS